MLCLLQSEHQAYIIKDGKYVCHGMHPILDVLKRFKNIKQNNDIVNNCYLGFYKANADHEEKLNRLVNIYNDKSTRAQAKIINEDEVVHELDQGSANDHEYAKVRAKRNVGMGFAGNDCSHRDHDRGTGTAVPQTRVGNQGGASKQIQDGISNLVQGLEPGFIEGRKPFEDLEFPQRRKEFAGGLTDSGKCMI